MVASAQAFTSLNASDAFVNLAASPGYEHRWWGRAIFRVDNVDAHHRTLPAQGLMPELPRDAPWGERFFHVTDRHELSFAELLPVGYRSAVSEVSEGVPVVAVSGTNRRD